MNNSSSSQQPDTSSIAAPAPVSSKKRYRKEKPWDTDDIDHWAPIKVDQKENPLPPPIEESSFATLFPRYRESYLREIWPLVTSTLANFGISCELDLIEGSMTVKTTRKCWDCSMILKARDVIKLLSRSIPAPQAFKVLDDRTYCDIIKIKNLVRNKERFVKRRQRLIGPNGCTLKAIELVTDCYVLVQGNTVSVIGSLHGIKAVRRLVEDCMRNIHPIYGIKILMIKKELQADPKLKEENWERFLPKFTKKSVQRKKPLVVNEKPAYTPFPPPQQPRKIDLAIESGEYFLRAEEKKEIKEKEKKIKKEEKIKQKKSEREKQFQPPKENSSEANNDSNDNNEDNDTENENNQYKNKTGGDDEENPRKKKKLTVAAIDMQGIKQKLKSEKKLKRSSESFLVGGK